MVHQNSKPVNSCAIDLSKTEENHQLSVHLEESYSELTHLTQGND